LQRHAELDNPRTAENAVGPFYPSSPIAGAQTITQRVAVDGVVTAPRAIPEFHTREVQHGIRLHLPLAVDYHRSDVCKALPGLGYIHNGVSTSAAYLVGALETCSPITDCAGNVRPGYAAWRIDWLRVSGASGEADGYRYN
jgi:hypothetical protein